MLIAGNWKMNTDLEAATELARGVTDAVGSVEEGDAVQVAVCPPFVSLDAVYGTLRGSGVRLGAQEMHHEDEGAFTGAVSANMLRSVGCHYVILGHSERRQYFGETDEGVGLKVQQALAHGLVPIVCVGETLGERRAEKVEEVVTRQMTSALAGAEPTTPDAVVVAYEPVWAIGTGETATPEQAQEVHALLRRLLHDRFGEGIGRGVELLYGGSMKPHNAAELLAQPDVDGGLIGGASLKPDAFAEIVAAARQEAA